jgi:hypothetical protein
VKISRRAGLAAAVVAAAGAAALLFSWERWIHPFVDGGRELIVPARLAEGERLYADVAYHYGPAGPWINAAALWLLGRHFLVLEGMGLAFSALLFFALFRLTERAGSLLSATAGTALAVALCLGAPNGGSFLFPYSFGTLYALAGVFLCLERIAAPPGSRWRSSLAVAGLTIAFAAKPEMGAAAAVTILAASIRAPERGTALRRDGKVVLLAAFLAAIAYVVAFWGLSWQIASPEGPLAMFSTPREWRNVHRVVAGLVDLKGSLAQVATVLFLDAILLGAAAAIALAARRRPPDRISAPEILWVALCAGAVAFFASSAGGAIDDRLPPLLMPMPLIALAAAGAELRRPLDANGRAAFLLFAFSALFGSRVLLGLAYGAYTTPYAILALPGLCATAAVLVLDRLPGRFDNALAFRRCAAALFAALALVGVLRLERLRPRSATSRIQTPAGSLRLPTEKAYAVFGTLEYLRARAHPGDRLAGFPEAGLFHFVTGMRNPFRQDTNYPEILDAPAEERALGRLEAAPPRFVLLINQPTPAFGPRVFGRDHSVKLWQAIERDYQPVAAFGDPDPRAWIGSPQFFIRVYERLPR